MVHLIGTEFKADRHYRFRMSLKRPIELLLDFEASRVEELGEFVQIDVEILQSQLFSSDLEYGLLLNLCWNWQPENHTFLLYCIYTVVIWIETNPVHQNSNIQILEIFSDFLRTCTSWVLAITVIHASVESDLDDPCFLWVISVVHMRLFTINANQVVFVHDQIFSILAVDRHEPRLLISICESNFRLTALVSGKLCHIPKWFIFWIIAPWVRHYGYFSYWWIDRLLQKYGELHPLLRAEIAVIWGEPVFF